jgi:carbamoyltransferase
MLVLGVGGSNHDFSAAVISDGRPVVAIEEERLQGIKHGDCAWSSKPTISAVHYCCELDGIQIDRFDGVFANTDLEGIVPELVALNPTLIDHHAAHAAASFFTAPVDAAALLVVDGCGGPIATSSNSQQLQTISCGCADARSFSLDTHTSGRKVLTSSNWTYRCENSVGTFYELVTEAIGFGEYGEGKTMGLAPYGDERLYPEMREFVDIDPDGRFTFNPYGGIYEWLIATLRAGKNPFMTRARIAKAVQLVFEDVLLTLARFCRKQTGARYLCYGGGCALNCSANGRLNAESGFQETFVFPAAGDNGLSIGAALFGTFTTAGRRLWTPDRPEWRALAYLGRSYSTSEYLSALEAAPVAYRRNNGDSVADLARRIHRGEIVGLFRDRSEFGPRALGHRSILADPRFAKTRDIINLRVKSRESFRPLAPMVPLDRVNDYFESDLESPFMLHAVKVRSEYRRSLGAVCHEDGSARVQTVSEQGEPYLYRLLNEYGDLTGLPVLLNTSFNPRSLPIVESPEDAVRCLLALSLDCLYLGDFVVEKHTPWADRSSLFAATGFG